MEAISLFAELLIIGLQTGIWVFLLVLNIFGVRWLQELQFAYFANWQAIITAVLLSIVYVFGIIFDRLADLAFSRWDRRLKEQMIPNAPFPTFVMLMAVTKDNEFTNRAYEYSRSRIRIARSASLNFGITTLLSLTLSLGQLPNASPAEKWGTFAVVFIFGSLLTAGAIHAWYRLTRGFFYGVKSNYDFYTKHMRAPTSTEKDAA